MSIPNTVRMKRRPTHPGEMLREDFLGDYELTVSQLAEAVGVSLQSINELLRGQRRDVAATGAVVWQLARVLAERSTGRGFVGRSASDPKNVARIKPLRSA